jgi:thiamine biosynthesis lipoprotein
MGSDAHVLVLGGPRALLERARRKLEGLQACWSRFLPDSDVALLNAAGGEPVAVTPETFLAVRLAVEGWRATAGRFDPTVQRALVAAGYDRTFAAILPDAPAPGRARGDAGPAPGTGGIALDPDRCEVTRCEVTLPAGVGIDLGGIGKGLGADLVVADLLAAGAGGACVNLGGDVRVAGEAPGPHGWVVAIEHPARAGEELARVALADGAVATTTSLARRWRQGGVVRHHLIDPATGAQVGSGLAQVSVVAGAGSTAEVIAKAAFVAGPDGCAGVLAAAGVAGLALDDQGRLLATPDMEELMV